MRSDNTFSSSIQNIDFKISKNVGTNDFKLRHVNLTSNISKINLELYKDLLMTYKGYE